MRKAGMVIGVIMMLVAFGTMLFGFANILTFVWKGVYYAYQDNASLLIDGAQMMLCGIGIFYLMYLISERGR